MPLSRFARFLTLMLAAIQFAAPAFVSVADGAFAKQVRDPGMHVEETGSTECTPPHAADCMVCRFLSGSVGRTEAPATFAVVVAAQPAPALLVQAGPGSIRRGFDARGPPASTGLS